MKFLEAALAGAIVGGGVAYYAENQESKEVEERSRIQAVNYLAQTTQYINELKRRADPYNEKWDSLGVAVAACKFEAESLQAAVGQYERSLRLAAEKRAQDSATQVELEQKIETLSRDLGSRHKGRYAMAEEFALIYECIFGRGRQTPTKEQYEQLAACCVEFVQRIQENFASLADFKKMASGGVSCYYDERASKYRQNESYGQGSKPLQVQVPTYSLDDLAQEDDGSWDYDD